MFFLKKLNLIYVNIKLLRIKKPELLSGEIVHISGSFMISVLVLVGLVLSIVNGQREANVELSTPNPQYTHIDLASPRTPFKIRHYLDRRWESNFFILRGKNTVERKRTVQRTYRFFIPIKKQYRGGEGEQDTP